MMKTIQSITEERENKKGKKSHRVDVVKVERRLCRCTLSLANMDISENMDATFNLMFPYVSNMCFSGLTNLCFLTCCIKNANFIRGRKDYERKDFECHSDIDEFIDEINDRIFFICCFFHHVTHKLCSK